MTSEPTTDRASEIEDHITDLLFRRIRLGYSIAEQIEWDSITDKIAGLRQEQENILTKTT